MAKVDYSSIVIPSNPKDRVIIAQCLQQINDSKGRIEAEKGHQAEVFSRLKEDYQLPKDIVTVWVNDLQDPEKRSISEAKQELIETGRHAIIDSAKQNKEAATSNAVAEMTPEQIFGKAENEPTMTQEEQDALLEKVEEEVSDIDEAAEQAEAEQVAEELKDEPFDIDDIEAGDTIPDVEQDAEETLEDEVEDIFEDLNEAPEAETEAEPEIEEDTNSLFESADGLGDEPTAEDLATVNANADAIAEEDEEDDLFADLDAIDQVAANEDAPVTEDTEADDDDIFGGLDDFDFDAATSEPEAEPESTVTDQEIDDIFGNL